MAYDPRAEYVEQPWLANEHEQPRPEWKPNDRGPLARERKILTVNVSAAGMATRVMLPPKFAAGDVFAGFVLVALYLVMLAGIAVAMPMRKIQRRLAWKT